MKENDMHLNSPNILPPVDTPLLIMYNGELVRAYRDSYVKRKSDTLVYILNASDPDKDGHGATVEGRFAWMYA